MTEKMQNDKKTYDRKKVFISYSWSSKPWVLNFATKLKGIYGIEVVIDSWSLKPGDDLNKFMEREVADKTIDKVLMICDKQYMEKANARSGGAGTEAQILSPKLYGENDPEKYIPIVIGFDKNHKPFLPIFLSTRLYVDFSDPTKEDESFENLINTIYGQGSVEEPQLAPIPTKILDHEANDYPLRQRALKIKSSIEKPRLLSNIFQNEFLSLLEDAVKKCKIEIDSKDSNEDVYIKVMQKLDNFSDNEGSFEQCLKLYLRSGEADGAILAEYFSNLSEYVYNMTGYEESMDAIKFLMHEQFLMVVGELIRQRDWDVLRYLTLANYKLGDRRKGNFSILQNEPMSIYTYNENHERYLSAIGALLKKRNKNGFNRLWCADVLLFYIWKLKYQDDAIGEWYPVIQASSQNLQYMPDFPFLENLNIEENMNAFLKLVDLTKNELEASKTYQNYTRYTNFTGVPAIKEFQKL